MVSEGWGTGCGMLVSGVTRNTHQKFYDVRYHIINADNLSSSVSPVFPPDQECLKLAAQCK